MDPVVQQMREECKELDRVVDTLKMKLKMTNDEVLLEEIGIEIAAKLLQRNLKDYEMRKQWSKREKVCFHCLTERDVARTATTRVHEGYPICPSCFNKVQSAAKRLMQGDAQCGMCNTRYTVGTKHECKPSLRY